MASVNIPQLKPREEASNDRQHLISNIVTLRTSDKQRRALPPRLIRVREREIRHIVERGREILDRNAPFHDPILAPCEIREQKLANGHGLLVLLENRIRLALLLELRIFDPLHALHVLCKRAVKRRVDRCVVHADERRDGGLLAQRDGHGSFRAHGVADQRAVFDVLLLQEALDVFGERGVVMAGVVRRVAVVSQVDRIDGTVQLAGKDPGGW